ncbi:hypothetical protein ACWKSP_21615 [Micromonosporaceae bacterium Da 78-11]
MTPSPEAMAWQRRADAWAQQSEPDQSQAVEPTSRWSEVASTGRPTFPADGVGWRTETAEWRATGARWRQTTEWRSPTGTHGWRSTTEAWQTDGDSEYTPPIETPTAQPAISSTAWSSSTDGQPGDTASAADQGPAWQQFTTPPSASWQQPEPARPQTPRPPAEGAPSWQHLVEPAPEQPSWNARAQGTPTWQRDSIDGSATRTDQANPSDTGSTWSRGETSPETPSWQRSGAPSWQTPRDDGRHLVREDDRAAWRRDADLGETSQQIGRRRAPESGSRPSGGTGWAGREDSDNWAGHTDTGSIQLFPDPAGGESSTWGARSGPTAYQDPTPGPYDDPARRGPLPPSRQDAPGRRALPSAPYDDAAYRTGRSDDPARSGRYDDPTGGRPGSSRQGDYGTTPPTGYADRRYPDDSRGGTPGQAYSGPTGYAEEPRGSAVERYYPPDSRPSAAPASGLAGEGRRRAPEPSPSRDEAPSGPARFAIEGRGGSADTRRPDETSGAGAARYPDGAPARGYPTDPRSGPAGYPGDSGYPNAPRSAPAGDPRSAPAGGFPSDPRSAPAGGYPGDPRSAPAGYLSNPRSTPADGYPNQPRSTPGGGYPDESRGAPAGGYPSDPRNAPAGGYPGESRSAPAGGYPGDPRSAPAGGYPSDPRSAPAGGGYPADPRRGPADGGFAGDPRGAASGGYPAGPDNAQRGDTTDRVRPADRDPANARFAVEGPPRTASPGPADDARGRRGAAEEGPTGSRPKYNSAQSDWREHTASWEAEPDTSSWTRDPDTGQWSRSDNDPRVDAWRREAARREAAGEVPALPAGASSTVGFRSPGAADPNAPRDPARPDDGASGRRSATGGETYGGPPPGTPRTGRPGEGRPGEGRPEIAQRSATPGGETYDDRDPRSAMPGNAPRSAMPSNAPRSAMPGNSPRSAMPAGDPRAGVPYGAPAGGAPGREPYDNPAGRDPYAGVPGRDGRGSAPGRDAYGNPPVDADGGASARAPYGNGPARDPYGDAPARDAYSEAPARDSNGGTPGRDSYGNPPGEVYGGAPVRDPYGRASARDPYGNAPARDPYGSPPADPYGSAPTGNPPGASPRSGIPAAPRSGLPGTGPRGDSTYGGAPSEPPYGSAPGGGSYGTPNGAAPSGGSYGAPNGSAPGGGSYGTPDGGASGGGTYGSRPGDAPYGGAPSIPGDVPEDPSRSGRRRAEQVPPTGRRRAAAEPGFDDGQPGPDAWRRELEDRPGPRRGADEGPGDDWNSPRRREGSAESRQRPDQDDWQRDEPAAWQIAEREEAARGNATYRDAPGADWRQDLADQSDLAEGESRRYGTSDFLPFRSSGSAAVPGSSNLSMTSTSLIAPVSEPSARPQRAGNGFQTSTGSYERRPVSGTITAGRKSDLLDPDDEEDEQASGGPLAAVGYTVIWYGVPVVLVLFYILVFNNGPQAHALDTLAKAAPQFGISLVLSVLVAVGLRWASGSWKAISVGLAAAVVGGGLATVLSSAITGNSLS